jgi:16S rRNA G966 N2-methylase RsmD
MERIIYYDKLFPIYDNKDVLKNIKIDKESVSYISSPVYAEKISKIILNHTRTNKIIITDCTSGCGGDTLSFLNKFKKVYSIEKNIIRFSYLLNNIKAYNFTKNSRLYCGNFLDLIKTINDHDVLYLDPPWGGKDYKKIRNLKLSINNIPLENILEDFINNAKKIPNFIIVKLPNNYDLKYLYDKLSPFTRIFMYNLKKMLIIVLEIKKTDIYIHQFTSSSLVKPPSESLISSNEVSELL